MSSSPGAALRRVGSTTAGGSYPHSPIVAVPSDSPSRAMASPVSVLAQSNACIVLTTRTILCWGDNQHGELGIGLDHPRPVLEVIPVTELQARSMPRCAPTDPIGQHRLPSRPEAETDLLDKRDFAGAEQAFARAAGILWAPTIGLGLARARVGLGKLVGASGPKACRVTARTRRVRTSPRRPCRWTW